MPTLAPAPKNTSPSTQLLAVITAVVVIAGLYLGKDLVIPFALALLLSFLLSTPVAWLERLRFGRALSVMVVLTTTLFLAGGLSWLGFQQLGAMAESLPRYHINIVRKLDTLRRPSGVGLVSSLQRISQMTNDVTGHQALAGTKELSTGAENKQLNTDLEPVPVQVVKDTGLLSSLSFFSESLIRFLGFLGAVAVLTLFMLLNRGHLRNRLFRLLGQGHLVLMTTALDEAAQRVSRYLLTQSLVNTAFGILLSLGLWLIGVPYAPFWGALAAFLRFVPYIGTFLAGAGPFILSLAISDGWSKPLLTVVLFVGIEAITSAAVEPWLYATRTGISSLAILLSTAFWTLLWGPIGLILATPLTVCLAVLGRNVPHLSFLHVLLGDEPVLTPEVCYYQRLLAMDEEEAAELAEAYLKEKTVVELYDEVLIPALALAEQDRHDNRLDEHRLDFLHRSTHDLVEEFAERAASKSNESNCSRRSVVCVPVRDEADALIGRMVARTLQEFGWNASALNLGMTEGLLQKSSNDVADIIILSALPPFALLPARALCRQLRRSQPGVKIVLGIWNSATPAEKIRERLGPKCSDAVVTSIQEVEKALRELCDAEQPTPLFETASVYQGEARA